MGGHFSHLKRQAEENNLLELDTDEEQKGIEDILAVKSTKKTSKTANSNLKPIKINKKKKVEEGKEVADTEADEVDEDDEDDDEYEEESGFSALPGTTQILIKVVGVIIVVGLAFFIYTTMMKPELEEPEEPVAEESIEEEINWEEELSSQGFSLSPDVSENNYTEVTSLSNVKDFFGNIITEDYKVAQIVTTTDGVAYNKYRAVTDDGVELYYLLGEYQGKKCIVTIPYAHFSTLPAQGVVICEIEIIKTVEDNYIVSYIRPIKDPKIK